MEPKTQRRLSLLLIGPLPPPPGGATGVFGYLVEDLTRDPRIDLRVIDISPGTGRNNLLTSSVRLLTTFARVLRQGRRVDLISFHASLRGRIWFGPLLFLISRLLRRPLVLRAFGGAFAEQYAGLPAWHRWLLRKTYFRAELCLLQTRSATRFFRELPARRAEWFSNYTRTPPRPAKREAGRGRSCRKLVFLGHVKRSKGIEVILESLPLLSPALSIDLYGPLYEGYRAEEIDRRGAGRARYRGVLAREEVLERLWDYDALVLPTFFSAEGYPGVILEAYAHGLPVIATDWMSIGEIVDEDSGILIPPEDPRAFAAAANALHADAARYERLRRGARKQSERFSDTHWTEQFVRWCFELCGEGRRDAERATSRSKGRTSSRRGP